jgi:hypothetical protein
MPGAFLFWLKPDMFAFCYPLAEANGNEFFVD